MTHVAQSAGNGASPDQRSAPGTPNGTGTPGADIPERVVAAAQKLYATRFVAESSAMHLREYRGCEVDRNELIFVFDLLEERVRDAVEELYAAFPGLGKVIGDEVPR